MTLPNALKALALLSLAPAALLAGGGREFSLKWKRLPPLALSADRDTVTIHAIEEK